MSQPKRDYDSTVARIAGNLLSGGRWYTARNDVLGHREQPYKDIIVAAVAAARFIVAEVRRTDDIVLSALRELQQRRATPEPEGPALVREKLSDWARRMRAHYPWMDLTVLDEAIRALDAQPEAGRCTCRTVQHQVCNVCQGLASGWIWSPQTVFDLRDKEPQATASTGAPPSEPQPCLPAQHAWRAVDGGHRCATCGAFWAAQPPAVPTPEPKP